MSTQQPYPPQAGPPFQYQQPKKSHTLRNVLLILVVLFVLFVGGCLALVAGVSNSVDDAIQEEEANDAPTAIVEGEAFTHDDYAAEAGWVVAKEQFTGLNITGLTVTNEADDRRTALLTFSFVKGDRVLGEIECSSDEISPGESSELDCLGDEIKPGAYDEIRVADFF